MSKLTRILIALVLLGIGTVPARADESKSSPATASVTESPDTTDPLASYRDAAVNKWEDDIVKFEAADATVNSNEDSILLLGSSSIRLWNTAEVDLVPFHVVRRGYGGAKFDDLAVYAERLIQPHRFRAVVIFVANDITGDKDGANDKTLEQLKPLVEHVVSVAHAHQPESQVLIVEVTPTPKRFRVWPEIRDFNAMLRELALSTPRTHFIATAGQVLDTAGNPRDELFREDQLHLNAKGYELWSSLIRRRLIEVLEQVAREEHAPKESKTAALR
ncbi:GDSL-type esterase/lipase family protein [Rubripirellula amarantea]|nr:GDSL-type esterase/lipase family protein [Rubripirellula amarantea]